MKIPGFTADSSLRTLHTDSFTGGTLSPCRNEDWEPKSDLKAGLPLKLLEKLTTWFLFERSFRVCQKTVLGRRYLLITGVKNIGDDYLSSIQRMWMQLRMPHDIQREAKPLLNGISPIFVGYEENSNSYVFKFYVETDNYLDKCSGESPFLLYQGFKWNPEMQSGAVVSQYFYYPNLSGQEIIRRISAVYEECERDNAFAIVRSILSSALDRISAKALKYMEVVEDGTSRRSFAVNLYDARMQMGEVSLQLGRIGEAFSVSDMNLDRLIRAHQSKELGCIAGGIHRSGEDFLNVYYGVEARRGLRKD